MAQSAERNAIPPSSDEHSETVSRTSEEVNTCCCDGTHLKSFFHNDVCVFTVQAEYENSSLDLVYRRNASVPPMQRERVQKYLKDVDSSTRANVGGVNAGDEVQLGDSPPNTCRQSGAPMKNRSHPTSTVTLCLWSVR